MAERDIFLAALIKKGFDETNVKIDTMAGIATGGDVSWGILKKLIAAGSAKALYPVGTQFIVPHSVYGDLLFDVVAHNVHKKPGDSDAPTMTLQMHNVIYDRPFDGAEAVYCVTAENYEDGLPAGTYHFLIPSAYTSDDLDGWTTGIQFTTTETVPVGGQIVIVGWESGKISAKKISTFADGSATTPIESNIVMSDGDDGTELGTILYNTQSANGYMNHMHRLRYGNNNWSESNIRQWLNSDAASGWYTPKTPFDRLSSSYASLAGFMNGLDPEFAAVLGPVAVTTRKNNVFENDSDYGDNTYTTTDKIFLLSNDEVGFSVEGVAQGSVLDFYNGAANADRIKYDYTNPATARTWWLRSPGPSGAHGARTVVSSGARYSSGACGGYGAAAACVIY